MLQSILYKDVSSISSDIRKRYGYAKLDTVKNYNNSAWIMENINILSPPDIALISEYNRDINIREKVVQILRAISKK